MQETPADSSLSSANDSLGAMLCSAREARGLSIHKAAQDMHVSDDIIVALEREDFASLGAPIFVRGHLRNYARLLGLPEDDILAAENTVDKLAPPPLITQQPGRMHAFGQRFAMPAFSIIVIVLLLVLGIAWWMHRPAEQAATKFAAHDMSTTSKPAISAPNASSIHRDMSVTMRGTVVETAAEKPKDAQHQKTQTASTAEVKPPPVTKPIVLPVEQPREVQVDSNATATIPPSQLIHAQFTLTQPSWVEVYDASGKRLYYALAPAGDTLHVSGAGPLQVFIGNAPGVSVEVNGAIFNLAPFIHPDNTARFRLGETTSNSDPAG